MSLGVMAKLESNMHSEWLLKKQMKPQYQFLLELSEVLLPRFEQRSRGFIANLYLMETVDTIVLINMPDIMIEHIVKICEKKGSSLGLHY